MSRVRVRDATISLELDPEGAPGVMTEVFPGVNAHVRLRSAATGDLAALEIAGAEAMERQIENLRLELARTFGIPARFFGEDLARQDNWAMRRYGDSLFEAARRMTPVTHEPIWNCRCHIRPPSEGILPLQSQEEQRAAETRAEEVLARVLAAGERQALDRLGVIPVIGGDSGDLVLVSRKSAYNLLRYERRSKPRRRLRFLPPRNVTETYRYCVQSGVRAPWQDRVASLVMALRGAEHEVWLVANRSELSEDSLSRERLDNALEIAMEPALRALAECRCEDPKLLEAVAHAAEASGGLV